MLQSFREPDDSSSESSDLQLEGPDSLRALDESFTDLWSEDRPLVFFDLKIDSESGFSDDHPHPSLAWSLSPQEKGRQSHLQGPGKPQPLGSDRTWRGGGRRGRETDRQTENCISPGTPRFTPWLSE